MTERILRLPGALGADGVRARLAAQRYRRFSPARLLRGAPPDSLRGVEQVLVPSWLVRLDVTTARRGRSGTRQTSVFVDGVSGECRAVPDGASVVELDATTRAAARVVNQVPAEDATRLAAHGIRWQVLRAGNVHIRSLQLSPTDAELVYLVTWLGYFTGAPGHIRIRCVNGVDGGVESAVYAMKVLRGLEQAGRDVATAGRRPAEPAG
ncbi:MAG: hypothetical protein GEV07_13055 [Streptosporangiales bacterium]|nr:hypothetical protein [Streptosporangiales bacterium]